MVARRPAVPVLGVGSSARRRRAGPRAAGARAPALAERLDIFLTVLYGRVGQDGFSRYGNGLVSRLVCRGVFEALRAIGARGRHRNTVLSLSGPVAIAMVAASWFVGLTLGLGLLMHPLLGDSIRVTSAETPTDFASAVYAAGTSLSITNTSDFAPATPLTQVLFLFDSIVGASIVSLTVTYVLQVYSAVKELSTLATQADLLADGTGDAAVLLARIGADGDFGHDYGTLGDLAAGLVSVNKSYHFFPVLFYFRPLDPAESVPRLLYLALDAVTLIEHALGDEHTWLKRSGAVAQIRAAGRQVLSLLEGPFMPDAKSQPSAVTDEMRARWRERFHRALATLREAGIAVRADDDTTGYVRDREQWDRHVGVLARYNAFRHEEVDPALRDTSA